ncbi:MAG TPA: NUDIX domain-containing protein [Candidatus Saccharimonadales bacterium]
MSPDYTAPILTVDGIVFQLSNDTRELQVLLIKRGFEPFKGAYALPGGYNPAGETTRQALDRVLAEKTGIHITDLGWLEQLYTFDSVKRDPRGHAVSVVYMGLGRNMTPGHDDIVQNPQFYPVTNLPELAYDHNKLIAFAHARLKAMITDTAAIAALLPPSFTFTELQTAYEAVLDSKLDKRNFRKKIMALDLLTELSDQAHGGAHRPARLYTFRNPTMQSIIPTFG